MKNKLFLAALIIISILSCNKKDDFNYPAGTVGISKITIFPTVALKGNSWMFIPKGTTFTDPGVTSKAGTADVPYTTSGTVNTSVTGAYILTYTATNADGFTASVKRTVFVYSADATAAANDLSGTYLRAATGQVATWTKLFPGVYQIDNPGGAVGVNLQVIALNPTGYTVYIPSQISSDGNVTSSGSFTYNNGTPPSYVVQILNPGYGTGLRTFVKQ